MLLGFYAVTFLLPWDKKPTIIFRSNSAMLMSKAL